MFDPDLERDARYERITSAEYDPPVREPMPGDDRDLDLATPRADADGSGSATMGKTPRWQTLIGYYSEELDLQSDWREEMREDERFDEGDQWDPEDAAMLRARGQYPMVYNVISPSINWLLGTERMNRTEAKVLPREKSDGRAAQLKSGLMKYVNDANNSDYAWSQAYADQVKVGVGWVEEGWQGDSGEEPVFFRSESWRNLVWDSRSRELDLSDARYIFRPKWVDLDIATRLFTDPHARAIIEAASTEAGDLIGSLTLTGDEAMDEAEMRANASTLRGDGRTARRRVRLIEAWYRVMEERPYMAGGQFHGELFDVQSPGHMASVSAGRGEIRWRTAMAVRVAIITTQGMVYDAPSPYRHNRFPFTPLWGNRRGRDNAPFGVIRGLKDIQRDINKRHSKALHILNSSKTIMDEGAVDDIDEFVEEVARPDAVIVKKQGKELKIDHGKELAQPQLDLMARSIQMIQQTSGITDEAMGRATNATSGRAIDFRQRQGVMATAHFTDNLRLAKRLSGEKLLSLMEQFYTEEKTFRITNSRGDPEYIEINGEDAANDILRAKADFIITEDPWMASQRQDHMQKLMDLASQIAPVAPQAVVSILDLLVETTDVPGREEIVSRIRKVTGMTDPDMTEEELAQDPEYQARMQAQAEEAAMAKRAAEAEIALKEADAAEKKARAGLSQANMERTIAETVVNRIGAKLDAIEAAMALMTARGVAPVADALLDEAETPTPNRREASEQLHAAASPVQPAQLEGDVIENEAIGGAGAPAMA